MMKISNMIHLGAATYLHREYKTIGGDCGGVSHSLGLSLWSSHLASFIMGAIFSALAGYIDTGIAVRANVRTTHAAAVAGDTYGDPLKDTAGPSLDVLMTILSTISILFAELFTMYKLFAYISMNSHLTRSHQP